ncbi:MAG: hypothetical protein NZT92_05985 [Abditibacteriales bacterium]|nr:hypothetical protein [Abditibacteriales bacterium]MDW8364236.1 hypothetical protein [Abditibacteriales bacterium]
MRLGEKVLSALEGAKPQGAMGCFSVSHDGTQVTLDVADCDRLGLLLNGIRVEWDATLSAAETKASAERIAQRVTYLTEDLAVVEWDEQSANAMLRSTPQEMQGQRSDYFELCLCGGRTLHLCRYRPFADQAGREVIPFHLTTDLLVRLLNDLEPRAGEQKVAV